MEFDYEFMIVNGNGKYNPETKQWDGIIRKLIDHVSCVFLKLILLVFVQ